MLVTWLKKRISILKLLKYNKIPNASGFLLTSVFNSKITEVENKIPNIKNLASKKEVTAVENKIPNVNNLVKKTDYAAEIIKTKNDYVTNAALDAGHKDLVRKTTFESELNKLMIKLVQIFQKCYHMSAN